MTPLKPCPFCGGEARVEHHDHATLHWVECGRCLGQSAVCMREDLTIEHWNRRAAPK